VVAGVWEKNPQPPDAIGGLGAKGKAPTARGKGGLEARWSEGKWSESDFCKFSIKITYLYAYVIQNSYLKAITHRLKAFKKQSLSVLNRINKVQILYNSHKSN